MTGKNKLPCMVGKYVCLIECLVSKYPAQYLNWARIVNLKYLSLEPWKYIQSQISHIVFFVAGAAFDQFDLFDRFWPMGLNLTLYYVCLVWHLIQPKRGQRSPEGPLGPSAWARRRGVEHPKLLVLYISYINLSILPILGQNSVGKIN